MLRLSCEAQHGAVVGTGVDRTPHDFFRAGVFRQLKRAVARIVATYALAAAASHPWAHRCLRFAGAWEIEALRCCIVDHVLCCTGAEHNPSRSCSS